MADFLKKFMEQQQAQLQAPPMLPLVSAIPDGYQPGITIPTHVSCGVAVQNGKRCVVMQVATPAGVSLSFLPVEMARQVIALLENATRAASSGVVVAPASIKGTES